MRELINKVLNSARNYSVWDFGLLKICMMSIGILLGVYFSNFFLTNILFVWIVCIVTLIYIMYKTFKKN